MAAEKSDVFNLDRTHQAGQVRALLSVFIYSVIIIMATAGGGTYDVISAGSERSIDAILQDAVRLQTILIFTTRQMITEQFFNILCDSNIQQNVSSLLEVRDIQGQLLSKPDPKIEDKSLQIVTRDKDVVARMINFRNVKNLAVSTPGTKTIAAAFSTNATDNLFCGRRGTIFKTLTAWGTSILKYHHLINELVFYVTRSV